MADELQRIADLLRQLNQKLDDLPSSLKIAAKQVFASELSQITNNAGVLTAGEFRVGNGKEPGSGFTGVRMSYPPMTYAGDLYPFVSISNDVLQVGISLTDGKLYAGGGSVVLDSRGISITQGLNSQNRYKFYTAEEEEIGYLWMYSSVGNSVGILNVSSTGNPQIELRVYEEDTSSYPSIIYLDTAGISLEPPSIVYIGDGSVGVDYKLIFNGETNNGSITWMEDENHFKLNSALLIGGDTVGEASTIALTNVTSGISGGGHGTVEMNGATDRDSTGWLKIMDGTTAKYIPFWTTITG